MSGLIHFEGAEYEICGDGCCVLIRKVADCDHFKVPSTISTRDRKRYRVKEISPLICLEKWNANMISFNESSEIKWVSASFIGRCRSTFILPPRVKRVAGYELENFPKIISEGFRQFVSTSGSRVIMNHFPLEVAYQHSRRQHFIIRETVRFVGGYSFYFNEIITSVVFPSSVEYIGDYSFYECENLRFILFKENSKLKIIGEFSFSSTSVKSVEIPSSVEEIRDCAFSSCSELESVTFGEDSKLKIIGEYSFEETSLESVKIPSNVEEIRDFAFSECNELKSVTFNEDSKLKLIGESSFKSTHLESVEFPSSVEEIRDFAFFYCFKLRSVKFSEDSKLKLIGKCSFFSTSLETVETPSNVEEIRDFAFSRCSSLRSVRSHLNKAKIMTIGVGVFANCNNLTH